MARVTVEDCVQKVPNRFELVLLAAQRARNLSRGEELTIDRDDDKNPVVALREIADETVDLGRIEQDLIKSLSRAPEPEPADEEVLDLIPTDQNIFGLQDVTAEEEAANLPAEGDDMSPEDLEAASRTAPPPATIVLGQKLLAYDPKADTGLIDAAYMVASQAHATQLREN